MRSIGSKFWRAQARNVNLVKESSTLRDQQRANLRDVTASPCARKKDDATELDDLSDHVDVEELNEDDVTAN